MRRICYEAARGLGLAHGFSSLIFSLVDQLQAIRGRRSSSFNPLSRDFACGRAACSSRVSESLSQLSIRQIPGRTYDPFLHKGPEWPPYLDAVTRAGGYARYERAHRARLAAIFIPKFPRVPAEIIPTIIAFWADCGGH